MQAESVSILSIVGQPRFESLRFRCYHTGVGYADKTVRDAETGQARAGTGLDSKAESVITLSLNQADLELPRVIGIVDRITIETYREIVQLR
jgi:hypothetical protein